MRLHDIKPAPGSTKRRKRVGRGESSGHGKTSGRGHKGQKARSGSAIKPGFEGGQMPLHRRLPKRGFSNAAFRTEYTVVNLDRLNERFDDGAIVNDETLRKAGLVRGLRGIKWDGIKLLAEGDVTKKFTIEVDKASAAAREKIEKAGGSLTLVIGKRKKKAVAVA